MILPKGTTARMGTVKYEKLDSTEFGLWVCLTSTYVVETVVNGEIEHQVHPESEKPLFKPDGRLNRFGFRASDELMKRDFWWKEPSTRK